VQYRLLMMGPPRPGDEPRPEQEAALACLRYDRGRRTLRRGGRAARGDPQQIALRSLAPCTAASRW
jgi:hypothetical protein